MCPEITHYCLCVVHCVVNWPFECMTERFWTQPWFCAVYQFLSHRAKQQVSVSASKCLLTLCWAFLILILCEPATRWLSQGYFLFSCLLFNVEVQRCEFVNLQWHCEALSWVTALQDRHEVSGNTGLDQGLATDRGCDLSAGLNCVM